MADIIITPGSSIMSFTSSLNYIQTITQDASGSLILQGSGSTGRTDLFTVNGNNGTLFSVSDDLSDSLFSVNTIAGLPVIEAFANNSVVMGQYGQNDFIITGNKVGIGVSNPSAKLQVTGTFGLNGSDSNFPFFVTDTVTTTNRYTLANKGMGFNLADDYAQLQLYGGNGGYIDFVNAAEDSDARIIYYGGLSRFDLVYGTNISITGAGLVGIGTTNPGTKLQVNGDGGGSNSIFKIVGSASDSFNWASSAVYPNLTSGENVIHLFGRAENPNNSAYVGFKYASDGSSSNMLTLGLYASDNLVNILANGNVGIGTTDPSVGGTVGSKFTIIQSDNATAIAIYNGTSRRFALNPIANGGFTIFDGGGGGFNSGITQVNGLVGIGTTNPGERLTVNGSIGLQTSGTQKYHIGYWVSGLNFAETNVADARLFIKDGGNVGIGTSNPTYGLVVNNQSTSLSGTGTMYIAADLNGSGKGLVINSNTRTDSDAGVVALEIISRTGGNTLAATVGGKVGIGITNPSQKLEVNGRALVNQFQYTKAINYSSGDLNNLVTAGFYDGSSMSNAPNSGWFYVTVETYSGDNNWIHQTATSFGSGNTANEVYTRVRAGGIWGSWKLLGDAGSISGTTNYIPKFTSGTAIGNSVMYDNSGLIGIGTTSANAKLHIAAAALGTSAGDYVLNSIHYNSNGNSEDLEIKSVRESAGNDWTYGGKRIQLRIDSTYMGYMQFNGYGNQAGISFGTGTTTSAPGNVTERMRITNGGLIGIGTTSPGATLAVGTQSSGTSGAGVAADNSIIGRFGAANTAARVVGLTIANTATSTVGNDSTLSFIVAGNYSATGLISTILQNTSTADTDMAFSVYANSMQERMRIKADGSVGIGTTSPSQKLHVVGSRILVEDTNAGIMFRTGGTNRYSVASTGGAFQIYDEVNSTNRLYITSAGNVGIGTTSPGAKLELQDTANSSTLIITADGANEQLKIRRYSNTNEQLIFGFSSSDFGYVQAVEQGVSYRPFALNPYGGNVGIGTTNPSYNLDVNGTTRVVGGIIGQDSSNNTRYQFAPELAYTLVGVGGPGNYKINSGAVSSTSMLRIKSTSTNGWLSSTKYLNGTVISEGLCADVIPSAGTLVFLTTDGEWGIADADVAAKSVTLLGIALNATSNIGDIVDVLIDGIIALKSNHDQISVPASPGAPLFVSTNAGNVTEVAPAGTGDIVRLVGHNIWSATSPTNTAVIRFQPDATWIEL